MKKAPLVPALLLVLCLLSLGGSVFAANVLLPEEKNGDSGSSSGLLGLTPREDKTSTPTETPEMKSEPAPKAAQEPTLPSNIAITPGGTLGKQQMTPEEQFIAKQIASGQMRPPRAKTAFDLKVEAYHEAQERKYDRDPTFVTEVILPKINRAGLKSALSVAVSKSYVWGPEEVKFVQNRLGYTPETIPQNCQIRLEITLETEANKLLYSEKLFTGEQSSIQYDSTALQNAAIQPSAVCLKPAGPLPRHGGMIAKLGDKYAITLKGLGGCPVPPKMKVQTLDIQYLGDGNYKCLYQ